MIRTGANSLAVLAGKTQSVPAVVQVGSLSLVGGVILGLLLYALVAGRITTVRAQNASTLLFSLIAWALAYGLLCVAFALVLPT